MKEYPNYSVLMSLYIREKPERLKMAIDSMLNQTVKPDEIVIVEDGPLTEGLYAMLDSYADCGVDVRRVRNEKNMGLGLALRAGMKVCRNELIARMDTDDISHPERCEKQLKYMMEHPEVCIVGGQISEFADNVDEIVAIRRVPTESEDIYRFAKERCPMNHVTVMLRKQDIEEVGGYQEWLCNEDYFLWCRLILAGKKLGNLPESIVSVRVGQEMYSRRSGWPYFVSEIRLQNYMRKTHIIGLPVFLVNCAKRFIAEILLPNDLRQWAYMKFARN